MFVVKVVEDWYGPLQWNKISPTKILKEKFSDEFRDDSGEESGDEDDSDDDYCGGEDGGTIPEIEEDDEVLGINLNSDMNEDQLGNDGVGSSVAVDHDQVTCVCALPKETSMMK